ncbi:MAG TPA: hypothetical protein VL854_07370 [Nitrososphaeraceae archaeon]|nr:hypothetical protein [Nitrososphaeraceae archaeon]
MSVILDTLFLRTKEITKSKHSEPKTSSILLISVAITMAIILLMYVGILYTEGTMKQYSICRDKIVGFEQRGMYPSPGEFRLALSSCESK